MAGATLGASAAFAANAQAAGTTYTVTGTGDTGGSCTGTDCTTLRAAITAANGDTTPDTITFALPGSAPWTIPLSGTPLSITGTGGLTIDGPGAGALSIVGGAAASIFDINAASGNPAVAISGLKLTGTTNGRAIDDHNAALTVTDDTISGNTSTSTSGAGIYAEPGAALNVSGSTITYNSSGTGFGGGIAAKYRTTITNSTISNNSASQGGGIVDEFGSLSISGSTITDNVATNRGGGIYSATKYGTTIDSSTISGNTAADGGGLDVVGYSFATHNPVVVSSSTIADNHAPRGAGIEIGQTQADTPVTIQASTISGNHDQGGGSSFGGGLLLAGELYNPVDVVDSTISGNTATDGGGVSLSYAGDTTQLVGTGGSIAFDNSTIDGNTASASGGGIYLGQYGTSPNLKSATAAINSTIVANDTANGAANDLGPANPAGGGGFNDTFSLIQNPGTGTLLSFPVADPGSRPAARPAHQQRRPHRDDAALEYEPGDRSGQGASPA